MKYVLMLLLVISTAYSQDAIVTTLATSISGAPAIVFGEENIAYATGTGASTTISFTVTNADLIIVGVTSTWASPTGVTFNSDALTLQVMRSNSGYESAIYTRANPDIATGNVVVSFAGATDATVTVIGYKKTHNTTPVSGADFNEGTSTSPAITISSATGAVVVDCLAWYSWVTAASATAGQTQKSNQSVGDIGGAVSIKSGAASVNMGWTLDNSREWSYTAISVNPE